MGICGSNELTPEEQARLKEEKKRAKALEAKMLADKERDRRINKLLLLGAGESGKSTLFKQMVMIYGTKQELSEDDLKNQIPVIWGNCCINAKTLAEACEQFGMPQTEDGKAAYDYIMNELEEDSDLNPIICRKLAAFWADPGVQECYDQRNQYQLNTSCKYFFDQIEHIGEEGFIPVRDDLLRTRVRTTGIVEHNFTIENNPFQMFDVGGQRNERKKWIHCFENVTAVMFVAAISEFDEVLYEDEHTNRVSEALHLFEEIAKSEWFSKSALILFLNKRDLFGEKIAAGKKITDSACEELQSFKGDCSSYEETTSFITQCFLKKNPEKKVYPHVTCATDSDNVAHVFNDVKDVIISMSLADAGLV